MVNYFRQLTLPWLVALLAMGAFSGLWYQYEAKTQQRMQIEQFAATLQLSVRPLLRTADNQWLKAQLTHIGYASGLPVTAIAVYDQHRQLLIATNTPAVLQQFTPATAVSGFSLLSFEDQWLAIQPVTDLMKVTEPGNVLHADAERYYLLLAFDREADYSIWLVPVLIVGLIGTVVLLLWQKHFSQLTQRLHTDISLLTHKLNQLRHGQLNVRVDDELVSDLSPLQQGLNELAQSQSAQQLQWQHLQHQQQQQGIELQQQCSALQQQFNQHQQHCQQVQKQVLARLHNVRQLLQQQHELAEDTFAQQLTAQLFLLQQAVLFGSSVDHTLRLPEILASRVADFEPLLSDRQIGLHVFEDADNARYELTFCPQTLQALLGALLQLGCRSAAVSDISLRVQLDKPNAVLRLSITSNGEGITARVRQLLQSNDTAALHWQESDIAIVVALAQQLNAVLSVQSLDGLGCTIGMAIPVSGLSPIQPPRLQHVLLFDSQSAYLDERCKCLSSLAVHVVRCSDLTELLMKSTLHIYDVALIFLPEPTQLTSWRTALQELNSRGRVMCYASVAQQQVWQQALQLPVTASPFYLLQLLDQRLTTASLPKLLVVDDNPTNLAFVRVLLQQQPVQLHTVSCGQDALKLCRQQRFDAILLDIQLPDIDGIEVARQLRQLSDYQHVPILAFTAHALEEEAQAFLQAGMNDVILKPLEAAKLEQILHWCGVSR